MRPPIYAHLYISGRCRGAGASPPPAGRAILIRGLGTYIGGYIAAIYRWAFLGGWRFATSGAANGRGRAVAARILASQSPLKESLKRVARRTVQGFFRRMPSCGAYECLLPGSTGSGSAATAPARIWVARVGAVTGVFWGWRNGGAGLVRVFCPCLRALAWERASRCRWRIRSPWPRPPFPPRLCGSPCAWG